MILPRLGIWNTSAGRWFVWERLFHPPFAGGGPTIWCRVRLRYLKTQRELQDQKLEKYLKQYGGGRFTDEQLCNAFHQLRKVCGPTRFESEENKAWINVWQQLKKAKVVK